MYAKVVEPHKGPNYLAQICNGQLFPNLTRGESRPTITVGRSCIRETFKQFTCNLRNFFILSKVFYFMKQILIKYCKLNNYV